MHREAQQLAAEQVEIRVFESAFQRLLSNPAGGQLELRGKHQRARGHGQRG